MRMRCSQRPLAAACRRAPLTARRWNGRWQIVVDFFMPQLLPAPHHNTANFNILPHGTLPFLHPFFPVDDTRKIGGTACQQLLALSKKEKRNIMWVYYIIYPVWMDVKTGQLLEIQMYVFIHTNIIHPNDMHLPWDVLPQDEVKRSILWLSKLI